MLKILMSSHFVLFFMISSDGIGDFSSFSPVSLGVVHQKSKFDDCSGKIVYDFLKQIMTRSYFADVINQ
jgi:hypothetical protein